MAKSSAKKGKMAKSAAAPMIKKIAAVKQPYTKGQTLTYMAQRASLKKAEAVQVMTALGELVESHLKKQGPGAFTLPGLLKLRVVRKPATKARKGINPFTGEPTTFKAKPARNVIKIRALKRLKEMVN
jgi:nucleoid DNA-binding protein